MEKYFLSRHGIYFYNILLFIVFYYAYLTVYIGLPVGEKWGEERVCGVKMLPFAAVAYMFWYKILYINHIYST